MLATFHRSGLIGHRAQRSNTQRLPVAAHKKDRTLMRTKFRLASCAAALVLTVLAAAPPIAAAGGNGDDPDWDMVTRIRDEGFNHSRVMEIMSDLADGIGPRLTGGPQVKRANEWTRDELTSFGLSNAHLEGWDFGGRGWSQDYVNVRMVAPDVAPLLAYAQAWTPSTNGVVRGKVVLVTATNKDELEKYKGTLEGAIVLFGAMRDVEPHADAQMKRYDDKGLEEIASFDPGPSPRRNAQPGAFNPATFRQQREFRAGLRTFWADEKVAAVIEPSRGDGGTLFVQGFGQGYKPGQEALVPTLTMAIEHYGRLARLASRKVPVEVELDVRNKWYDDAATQYNTIAEIPGTDPKLKDQVVMLGGHLDSWHTGTGATDNGAGVGVMMEAVRILEKLYQEKEFTPRRTIRIALWTGEEEGLLGSRAYVKAHFGGRPDATPAQQANFVPGQPQQPTGPLTLKPEDKQITAYFNVDNGTGKIRGIYTQGNAAVVPIFTSWFEPFHDLGAQTITMKNTGGTDHLSFDGVDIPGFQFIQDEIEYGTRTHHSNMDVYERLQPGDMMQNAVIVATFVAEAANRENMMPRKPLPHDEAPARQRNSAGGAGASGQN